jgi:hypothetical protein
LANNAAGDGKLAERVASEVLKAAVGEDEHGSLATGGRSLPFSLGITIRSHQGPTDYALQTMPYREYYQFMMLREKKKFSNEMLFPLPACYPVRCHAYVNMCMGV